MEKKSNGKLFNGILLHIGVVSEPFGASIPDLLNSDGMFLDFIRSDDTFNVNHQSVSIPFLRTS